MGARLMTQVVITIMASDRLVKNASRGFPFSPSLARDTPRMIAKVMRPRILEPEVHSPLNFQVRGSPGSLRWFSSSKYAVVQLLSLQGGLIRAVLYCCIVAWTMLGGTACLIRSIRVSGVVTSRALIFLSLLSCPETPGWMETTRMMPRMTARMVVVK